MPFVHGHPRESGWVVSHYRRPQRAGDEQLDLVGPEALPGPRDSDDQVDDQADDQVDEPDPDESRDSVRSIPRRTASTR